MLFKKIRLTSQPGGVPNCNIHYNRPVGHRAKGNVHTQSTPNSFTSRGAVGEELQTLAKNVLFSEVLLRAHHFGAQ